MTYYMFSVKSQIVERFSYQYDLDDERVENNHKRIGDAPCGVSGRLGGRSSTGEAREGKRTKKNEKLAKAKSFSPGSPRKRVSRGIPVILEF